MVSLINVNIALKCDPFRLWDCASEFSILNIFFVSVEFDLLHNNQSFLYLILIKTNQSGQKMLLLFLLGIFNIDFHVCSITLYIYKTYIDRTYNFVLI